MRIVVSKAYLKWRKANKSNMVLGVIDKFLMRVAIAPDASCIVPQPKAVGNNLRKEPGVVDEFSLAKEYRIYSKCLELTPGVMTFCLAVVGSKGEKTQKNDILTALGMVDNVNAVDWEVWNPIMDPVPTLLVSESVESVPAAPEKGTSDVKVKKSKGKPVDENGLTVAERKALRKKEQQERMARQAKEQKQNAERAREEQQKPVDVPPVVETPVAQDEAKKVIENVADNGASDAERKALQRKQRQERMAWARKVKMEKRAQAEQQKRMDNTSVAETPVVAPVPSPVQSTVDAVEFKDYADIQYELEMIEHKMNIEQLNIKITKQEIAVTQHEIALEELAIRRLELIRMQKTKSK